VIVAVVLALISAGEHYIEMGEKGQQALGWVHALEFRVPFWMLWALLAPLVAVVARSAARQRSLSAQAVYLTCAGLVMATGHAVVEHTLHRWFAPELFPDPSFFFPWIWKQAAWWLPDNLLVFGVLAGITYTVDLRQRYREREILASRLGGQLARAELQALRMQMNPHFLFNTMNSIAMLVRQRENEEAVRVIAGLSDLLRSLLDEQRPHEVALREEITFLRRYLEIEQIRFRDRLHVNIAVDDSVLDAQVPSLVLQPLVENALRHGIGRRSAAGQLDISAHRSNGTLILRVSDDGPGLQGDNPNSGMGVGLRNTRARLHQLYGASQSLELKDGIGGGTVAVIEVPYHIQPVVPRA